jgi:hypothetical protein
MDKLPEVDGRPTEDSASISEEAIVERAKADYNAWPQWMKDEAERLHRRTAEMGEVARYGR